MTLRDRFACGLKSEAIQKKLLTEMDLTFNRAAEIAQSATMDAVGLSCGTRRKDKLKKVYYFEKKKSFQQPSSAASFKPFSKNRAGGFGESCYRCGNPNHKESDCYFKTQTCNRCGKIGHIQRVCRGKPKEGGRNNTPQNDSQMSYRNVKHFEVLEGTTDSELNIYGLQSEFETMGPFCITLRVENLPFNMEVDTGAAVSVMSRELYHKNFKHLSMQEPTFCLRTYTGERVVPGMIQVKVDYQNHVTTLPLYIVEQGGPPLLGRDWLAALNIDLGGVQRQLNFLTESDVQGQLNIILETNKELFNGEPGKLKDFQARLTFKDGYQPRFMKARTVPFSIKPAIEEELHRLERLGLITKVNHSDWATPIVPVVKKDGTIRICGDYKVTVNPMLQVDQYPIPRPEELFAALSKGKKFSKIDLAHAFQQIEVAEEFRKCLTLNTHLGLFQVNRLPFGIASSPAIFQMAVDQVLQGLENVVSVQDDILVTGENVDAHLRNLSETLSRLRERGLRVKSSKCEFFKDLIEYLGHKISESGLQPSDKNIEAIRDAPKPTDITQLRAFLGMINYYGRFLPNLSTLLKPLHVLLQKDQQWTWTSVHDKIFTEVKQLLMSTKVLAHYDPTQKLILACDASSYGIGATLSHEYSDSSERPIAFTSRTLTSAEINYSQIEKEALALVYGVTKFHQYIYGRPFTLLTDHEPLAKIFGPTTGIPTLAASRIQRWALILASQNYTIQYRPSSKHANADALSRIPLTVPETVGEFPDAAEIFQMAQVSCLPVLKEDIARETRKDKILSAVLNYTRSGWPRTVDNAEMKPFIVRKNELTVQQGCLLWGIRVLIPASLQSKVLDELHSGHWGIVRTKSIARGYVWWDGLDQAIEKQVGSCENCLAHHKSPPLAPLHPWTWPEHPWQRIHADFAGPFQGMMFLIIVDAHSKWPEAFPMTSTTAEKTIDIFRETFSRNGLPLCLVTDNGPQFTSSEFQHFLQMNGIKHYTPAPYHPSTNGLAERFVQTLKLGLKRNAGDRSLQQRMADLLLTYRNTEHPTTGESPAMLFTKRRLRTRLDLLIPSVSEKVASAQASQTLYHDHKAENRIFSEGQKVYARNYKNTGNPKWILGSIVSQSGPINFNVEVPGGIVRRHQDQLLKTAPKPIAVQESEGDSKSTPGRGKSSICTKTPTTSLTSGFGSSASNRISAGPSPEPGSGCITPLQATPLSVTRREFSGTKTPMSSSAPRIQKKRFSTRLRKPPKRLDL